MKTSLSRIRHARSKQEFPFLPLEEGEYVELSVERSKLGLILIWGGGFVVVLGIIILGILVSNSLTSRLASALSSTLPYFYLLIVSLILVAAVVCFVGSKIYKDNHLYVTNKRIFEYRTSGLFSRSTNIIELYRIEDVSFKQTGIFDYLFHIGTVRMSTVGDETTYTFPFVDTPTDEVNYIAHLIHLAKDRHN